MQITSVNKIKGQKVKIDCDDGSSYELDRTVAAENCIQKGEALTLDSINNLLDLSEKKQALSRAVWYLSRSDHSKGEILSKLKRAGFSPSVAEHAIAKLCEYGMLDDEKYAARLAENYKLRNLSPKESVAKIVAKRIDREIAMQAVYSLDFNEHDAVKSLIERKYKHKLVDNKGRQSVFAALCRKGFSMDEIHSVINEYNNGDDYLF